MARQQDGTKPYKATGTRSRYSASRATKARKKADDRATFRMRCVQVARLEGGTLNEQLEAVENACAIGLLPGEAPSRTTLWEWLQKADQAGDDRPLEVADFEEEAGRGRKPVPMGDVVEAEICQRLADDRHPSIRKMWLSVQGWAQERGHPKPSYWQVYRFVNEVPAERIAAYRNGSRAAVADTMHHPPVPADYTHQIWSLDEMDVPVWIRQFDRQSKRWIAVVVSMVLVLCNRSRAIVGYYVADPKRRGKTSGFDSTDVLVALLGAMLPELAPPACRTFSGHRPEVLRWDKAQQHVSMLEDVERSGIYVPDLPGRTPYPRGKVERPVDTLKALCSEITGYKWKWLPLTDRVTKNPKATRSEAVATNFRERTKIPIEVEELHTYERLCEEIDRKVIAVYNEELTHRKLGTQPEIAYHENFDRALVRNGRDALYILSPKTGVVRKGNLEHLNTDFYIESQGREVPHQTQVRYRPDPLLRGIFVEAFGENDIFCMPAEEWARLHNGSDVARDRAATARQYSDEGERAREDLRRKRIGEEAARRADGELERRTAAADERWEKAQARKREKRDSAQIALDLRMDGVDDMPSEALPPPSAPPAEAPKKPPKKTPKKRRRKSSSATSKSSKEGVKASEPKLVVSDGGGDLEADDELPAWLVHDPRSLIRVVNE